MHEMKLLIVIVATVAWAPEASPSPPDRGGEIPQLAQLIEQHAVLMEQVREMQRQIERLVRAERERRTVPVILDDLDPLLEALNSESFQERNDSEAMLRRVLVDRMWQLVEMPDGSPEAVHRVKSIVRETSAMIRLTDVAVDLGQADRDALWNLLDARPEWIMAALGDDPDEVRSALQATPQGHDRAAEIVLAALIRDEMRPIPQMLALSSVHDASSPQLRNALRSLLMSLGRAPLASSSTSRAQRKEAAEMAVTILARRPSPDLAAFFLAYLGSAEDWSMSLEMSIVHSLVRMRATEAAGQLLKIAKDKGSKTYGGSRYQDLLVKPGDPEIVGAALLLELDLEDLGIERRSARNDNLAYYYGFPAPKPAENPDRQAALVKIENVLVAAGEAVNPPGDEEAPGQSQD